MSKKLTLAGCMLLVAFLASPALSQGTANRTSVTGLSGSGTSPTQGLQQSGELTSGAAISRDPSSFVGGSQGNILSQSGSTGLGGLSDLTRGLTSYGLGGGFGLGGLGRGGLNNGSLNQGTGTTVNQQTVRCVLRIGFTPVTRSSSIVSAQFIARLPRIPGLEAASGIDVKMDGQTVVLQGVVANQRQADLIGRLALLEPGIRDVQNELKVASEPPPLLSQPKPPATDSP
ncbi:MAG: BON domain-containing protein [Pirellulaceae bacterium]